MVGGRHGQRLKQECSINLMNSIKKPGTSAARSINQELKASRINNVPPTLKSLTPWLMEPGGSVPHPQELSNNSYPHSY